MQEPIVEVVNLKKYFPITAGVLQRRVGWVKAVDDVSFKLYPGEVLGLVGESGCGKTTTGKAMINLERPTSGSVLLNMAEPGAAEPSHVDLAALSPTGCRAMRKHVQIVFQNPYGSLNPRQTVGQMFNEIIRFYKLADSRSGRRELIDYYMDTVGLQRSDVVKFPHEFSGGQRQRIGIARALIINPKVVVCDEPVSALDVSIQAQIINLLGKLREQLNLTLLFIAHDLAVVKHISDRIGVMYLGKIVEVAPKGELYANPRHPYTEALLSALPIPDPERKSNRILLKGEIPSPVDPPTGCRFHTRCPIAKPVCSEQEPLLTPRDNGAEVACHFR